MSYAFIETEKLILIQIKLKNEYCLIIQNDNPFDIKRLSDQKI